MLIYDIEIMRAIPSKTEPRQDGIEYCGGWSDTAGMGISVVGCYDYVHDTYRVFCQDNLPEFLELMRKQDVVCGFNNSRFDNKVLASNGVIIREEHCYDLFTEIQRGLGCDFNDPAQRRAGYNLEAMAFANFRLAKSGKGALAPVAWQQGKVGLVIDYCLHDVHLTKRLLDRVIRCGRLTDPHDARQTISVRKPGI